MLEDLKYLLELQEIDLRIKEQELASEQYPAEMKKLTDEINNAAKSLEVVKAKLTEAENEKKNWEEQISKARAGLEKSQQRLNTIRTNREYDAVHAEIEAQKGIINSAEQRRKNIMAQIEVLQKSVSEHEAELERIKGENDPQIKELQSKIDAIDSTIAAINVEREAVIPKISRHIYRQYDNIRSKKKSGRAVSVVNQNRTCTVCYKVLEPQIYNDIKKGTKIIFCQSCGSILIWDSVKENDGESGIIEDHL